MCTDATAVSRQPERVESGTETPTASQPGGIDRRRGFTSDGFVSATSTFVPRWFPGTKATPKLHTDVPRRTEFLICLHEYSR